MKIFTLTVKALAAIFLAIAVAVHVLGLFMHVSDEPMWSHVVHFLSYGLCLAALMLRQLNPRLLIYLAGAVYPFFFHARCAINYWLQYNGLSGVCLTVVIMLPLAAWLIWYETEKN